MQNIEKFINRPVLDLKPSGIRKYFNIAQEMENVISLGIGEPDFVTPWHIRDAGIYSLEKGHTYYTANNGLEELRNEISLYQNRRFGMQYDPMKEILVTIGGSEGVDLAIRTLVAPGDEVIIPEPCFVCYVPITELAGGVPVTIDTKVENDFCVTAAEIREKLTPKTKLIVLSYPSNPTGGVMKRETLQEIADLIRDRDIFILSDEIYAELSYAGHVHASMAQIEGMRERTIVVNGFSKAYAMTGWRLGYVCGTAPLVSAMAKIHQFAIMCSPTQSQFAAIEALRQGDGDIDAMREEYDLRRRFITDGLNKLGLECFEAKGAFYAFPCIRSTGLSSDEFCEKLLRQQHVAVIPGSAFGSSGEGFVRCSYASSIANITEALTRIGKFLTTL